ncbi:MAG: glycosyltransferase family 2 protein [Chloroflexi bacterium]|nr:glycosyltransferase family 2 protein [Chloroflexota bacterium]
MDRQPLVTIVMPVRNEAAHLERGLDAIDAQTYPSDRIEILVVDGGSTDGTLDLVRRRMDADPRIRLLGGAGVNTPAAMQLGIEAARGEVVAKIDGHGWVNERFVERAVTGLEGDEAVGCVGPIIVPVAESSVERAIAVARFSRLGVGGGVYTLDEREQETDTVQCGVYRRSALMNAGGFDPDLPFGEDEEANHRLREAGWRICLDPVMRFSYRVRPSVRALFRQYFRYGRARVAVVRRHPGFLRLKHAAPAVLVVILTGSLVIGPIGGWRVIGAPWIGYGLAVLVGGAYLAARAGFRRIDLVALALAAIHLGYGLGSLRGLLDSGPQRGPQGGKGLAGAGMEHERMADQPEPEQQNRQRGAG